MTQRHCRVCNGWHDVDEWPAECAGHYQRHKRADLNAPMVMRDIEPYRSPVDGKLIGSRSSRREDLKANDCVEWEPSLRHPMHPRTPGKYVNPKFAAKRGLPLREDIAESLRKPN